MVVKASDFKNQNMIRVLYMQYFMDEDIGFDYYDLFFFFLKFMRKIQSFFFLTVIKSIFLIGFYVFLYAFIYFDVLLRTFPSLYNYSSFYQNFQNYCYLVEDGVLKLSGKAKQEQKFLDFFANLRN